MISEQLGDMGFSVKTPLVHQMRQGCFRSIGSGSEGFSISVFSVLLDRLRSPDVEMHFVVLLTNPLAMRDQEILAPHT